MLMNKITHLRRFASQINNSFYLTTPIFYVNASPHIGHLYTTVISDAIKRYRQLRNPEINAFLSTGTDEHGTKVQQAAADHKVPVREYCDAIAQSYKSVFDSAGISYDAFMRTSSERHKEAVGHFWGQLKQRGHIYSAKYGGWYCVSDETFLTDSQLKTNSNGDKFSLESGHPVEWTEEINYMFSLSKFQDDVLYWLKKGNRIKPAKFEKILFDYLSEPLPDVSVSRPANRVHWAIPVPGDESQTVYVWLDALINYLTAVGYPNPKYRNQWPPNLQVIGKDILKFHGIYWPAFLFAAGLEPPQELLVHSHWTVDGQKMSKSKFNVVDPREVANIYTMEGMRYFLLREGVAHSDGNYSSTKALRILNSELADTLGNLLSRGCAKALNPRQIYPKLHCRQFEELSRLDATKRLIEALEQLPEKTSQHYNSYNFYLVVDQVIATLHAANNFFETCKPWELKSTGNSFDPQDDEKVLKLETIISITLDTLRVCGIVLQPIIPEMSGNLLDKLNVPQAARSWKGLDESFLRRTKDVEHSLGAGSPALFKRIILQDESNNNNSKKRVKKINK